MDWTGTFNFRMPTRILFGANSARQVGEVAQELGSKAPMVLTDPGVYKVGLTAGVEQSLKEAGLRVEVCDAVTTEPTLASIDRALAFYRERGCDLIVAVGGGSSLDSSKSVSLLLGNEGKLTEYHQQRVGNEWRPGKKVLRKGADIIAIPTTSGTGSEVTSGSGVFNPETGIKGWAGAPILRATVAICDPLLAISMPPRVTADTGMDALSQAIECYLNGGFKPLADTLALKAIEIMGKYLPRAFANGTNLEARAAMMYGATTTGLAFGNGGLIHVHTYAEVLGDLTHLPHGRLIGLMLPHVLEFSLLGCEERLADIGRALGEKVDGLTAREAAEKTVAAVRRLAADCEIDEPLRTYKVSEETIRTAAERVYAQHGQRSATGPRWFRSVDEVLSLLQKAY